MAKQASAAGLARFQDARFGMFIHWGLYSVIAKEEWVMHTQSIPVAEYEALMPRFNPHRFNAEEWVQLAADAGQKYIVITSRHHDGFSMYDTALSEYKVTRTPFGRDPLKELADACARRGDVKLGFYSSLLDWHHPAYRFRAESGLAWSDYIGFLHGQVRELCTQFGDLACLWFDGDWPRHEITDKNRHFVAGGSFEYERLYDMIHTLQPDAVIHNNRHAAPLPGEDVQGFEQNLPGENTAGFNETRIFDLPLEVCMTINDHWGYSRDDRNTKTVRHLVHVLARSAAAGANFLLNVGPTAEGEIVPEHAARLRGVGRWLRANGAAIYGTRAGVVGGEHVVGTRRDDVHYAHVLDDVSDVVSLRGVPGSVTRARLLVSGAALEMTRAGDRVTVTVPQDLRDPPDTVVELAA